MSDGRCDLCSLPLPRNPIVLNPNDNPKLFCCEGCARVYEVARDTGMLEVVIQQTGAAKNRIEVHPKPIHSTTKTAFFEIRGMWCAGCAVAAERVLDSRPGISNTAISFAIEQGRFEYDPELVNPVELLKKLSPLGYRTALETTSKEKQERQRAETRIGLQLVAALAFGMEIMVLYLVQLYPAYATGLFQTTAIHRIQYVVWLLATPVVFYGGSTFLVGAWRAMRARTVGMDTLVTLGVLASYFYSAYATVSGTRQTYFDSASMIVQFILIGRYLEQVGGAQARKDLRSLLRLQPELAWRKTETGWAQVQAASLAVGDTIMVKPGEQLPADGRILDGRITLDESMLTGEALPVTKDAGDLVYAGTIAREGAFTGEVLQPPGKTRLSQISDLVTHTLSQKPRIQRLADRASTYFAFAILLLAALSFAGWFLRSHSIGTALMVSVTVLVVACPCALGLATPLTMAVTMGRAAQKGIIVRTPEALETAYSIQRMVFDKTGTLTRGWFSIVEVNPSINSGLDETGLLQITASVEQFSEHPIAQAIVRANRAPLLPAEGFVSVRGAGTSAQLGSLPARRVMVGSTRLVNVENEPELLKKADRGAARGETIVWVAQDEHVAGYIALKDQPNPTAYEALKMLQQGGIQTVMLSGDTPLAAAAIAGDLEIGSHEGSCTPEEKALKIKEWQQSGEQVGMVGDGVNDAPALAQANLSVTTAGGADISGQASDIVLTRSDLQLIPWLILLSRQTRTTILQNLGWAFAYNLVSVPLAMTGRINPVIAAVAMAVSSLLVVINSLRLRRI